MKKNTVTKMLAVVVTIAMLGGLTACGSSSKEPASGSAAATGEATQAEAKREPQGMRQEPMRQPLIPEW